MCERTRVCWPMLHALFDFFLNDLSEISSDILIGGHYCVISKLWRSWTAWSFHTSCVILTEMCSCGIMPQDKLVLITFI